MEDDLNILSNGRRLKYFANGRQTQYVGKWMMTLTSENELNFFLIGTLTSNLGKVISI
jgi:hypothetical protein